MPGSIGKPGDVVSAILRHDQDIVLAIPPCTGATLGNRKHGFDGNHHTRLKYRVDILSQFKPGFPAVIVRQHTKRMTVAEGPELEQVPGGNVLNPSQYAPTANLLEQSMMAGLY